MSEIHIHLHLDGLDRVLAAILTDHRLAREILRNTERLIKMSGTLSEQLAAAQADTNAKLDAISTDVTEIGGDVDTLLAGMNAGDSVTQEMVDAATSIRDRVSAVKDGLDAINAKVPPAA